MWQYFAHSHDTSRSNYKWRWREEGREPPDGLWWVNRQSSDEVVVTYSGDPEGSLPTTSLVLRLSDASGGIDIWLEFSVYMSLSEVEALGELLTRAGDWVPGHATRELALLEFYQAPGQFSTGGGVIVLAYVPNDEHVTVVIWSRVEEYEVRYELSHQALVALHEMFAYALAWKENPKGLE